MSRSGPKQGSLVAVFFIAVLAAAGYHFHLHRSSPLLTNPAMLMLVVIGPGLVAVGVIWAINRHRTRNFRQPWCCHNCGYDLRGLAAGAACPECGAISD